MSAAGVSRLAEWPKAKRKVIRFRMRREARTGRFVVEQHCSGERWIPLHYDDLASNAYLEVKSYARRGLGVIECADCGLRLLDPQLSPDGVKCLPCIEKVSAGRGLAVGCLFMGLLWLAVWAAHHFGVGVR
jgi:hypothetical protein